LIYQEADQRQDEHRCSGFIVQDADQDAQNLLVAACEDFWTCAFIDVAELGRRRRSVLRGRWHDLNEWTAYQNQATLSKNGVLRKIGAQPPSFKEKPMPNAQAASPRSRPQSRLQRQSTCCP
jgi:hypothetical protein